MSQQSSDPKLNSGNAALLLAPDARPPPGGPTHLLGSSPRLTPRGRSVHLISTGNRRAGELILGRGKKLVATRSLETSASLPPPEGGAYVPTAPGLHPLWLPTAITPTPSCSPRAPEHHRKG